MAKENVNISVGKQGMNRDVHPMNLAETEYSFALNVNYEDESGNNYPMLQNEHSNLLTSKFKEGFKVIGFVNDLNEDKTYYFLTNPETKESEIGYISNIQFLRSDEDLEAECGCNVVGLLDTPLEDVTQQPTHTYTTIINDACNKCLKFDLNYPIKQGTIQLKDEKCGKRLYWTDALNPPRYLDLTNLEDYLVEGEPVCGVEPVETCLDCEKLRVFQRSEKICLAPEVIQYGGRLDRGTYEFLVAYSDKQGNELTEYFSITNPITIFDPNNTSDLLTKENLRTNLGIRLKVTNLDSKFGYYKVVVIQNADVNNVTTYFEEGVHTITDDTVLYTTSDDKQRTTLNRILTVKPVYLTSEIMTSSNGYLFQAGLTAQKEMNLQPVVNFMGSFLRWQTSVAKENLYADGVNNSLYKGYMRDEVYPFSIRFFTTDGFETANFILPNRPATETDVEIVNNLDVESVNRFAKDCQDNPRTFRWQFYNTASKLGFCPVNNDSSFNLVTREVEKRCNIDNVLEVEDSVISINPGDNFFDLFSYIERFREEICDPTDEKYNAQLCGYLSDTYPDQNCTPYLEDSCGDLTLDTSYEEVYLSSIEGGGENNAPIFEGIRVDESDYVKNVHDEDCTVYLEGAENGGFLRDQSFMDDYTRIDTLLPFNNVQTNYAVVYKRIVTNSNFSCNTASDLSNLFVFNSNYVFKYYGGDDISDIVQSNYTVSATATGFDSNLHRGAMWFKIDFTNINMLVEGESPEIFLEIPKINNCRDTDDISTATQLRYSIFENCSASNSVQSTIFNLSDGVFTSLKRSDFNSDVIFIAIDQPYIIFPYRTVIDGSEVEDPKYILTPNCSCIQVYGRRIEYERLDIKFDKLVFGKRQRYTTVCDFKIPTAQDCGATPFEYGKFGYYKSTEKYPCNDELYNSKTLQVDETDIPEEYLTEFKEYFEDVTNGTQIVLNENSNFSDKNILHYRFPDSTLVPFLSNENILPFEESLIYPIGVTIDNEIISSMLDLAVKNNLISQNERDSIVSYEIFRGDRTLDKGIIAKGLLYDVYKYTEGGTNWFYPNYPYNDLGEDKFNLEEGGGRLIQHPYLGSRNDKFTFHSPDTHFSKPTLPTEIKVEGFMSGNSRGRFADVEGHSEWVILGNEAFSIATTLAIAETVFEAAVTISQAWLDASSNYWFVGGFVVGGNPAGAASSSVTAGVITAAVAVANGTFKVGRYRYEWLKLLRDNGKPKNFASYYSSEGFYNRFINESQEGEQLRGVSKTRYLKSGNYKINDSLDGEEITFNNTHREESVFISLGSSFPINWTYSSFYENYDNNLINESSSSRFIASDAGLCGKGVSNEVVRNISSPYVSLKNNIINQYGNINSIKWLSTGYCGNLRKEDNFCETIFGGDIFITRFSLKRKLPFFYTTAFGLAPRTPFSYSDYRNIGRPKFYCDYQTAQIRGLSGALFPDVESEYSFDCITGRGDVYVDKPSKMYLYSYGIPMFLVESEINNNFRLTGNNIKKDFYPNVGDYVDWTQENTVSIKEPNFFSYNSIFSKNTTFINTRMLPDTYEKDLYECLFDAPNGVIYSAQDSSEQDLGDPWLTYKPLDFYQFPTSAGKLIDLRDIESSQILGRFENQVMLFNAIDQLRDRLNPSNAELGTGGIFASRPLEFKKTDLGYAGTQHKQMVSCEFGHFWVDAKRGQVFRVDQNGRNLQEITQGLRNWFKEHLPFKILRHNIEGLTEKDIDNNFKSLGISMGWDSRYRRVFLTKKDYIPKKDLIYQCGNFYSKDTINSTVQTYTSQGYTYEGIVDCKLKFTKQNSGLNVSTNIIAFFDTTSMQSTDGEAASQALTNWFNTYKQANPNYNGELYVIPYANESYVDYARLLYEGTINPTTGGTWGTISNLPPDLGTPQWTPLDNIILLAFVDETNPEYHESSVSFLNQPKDKFLTDYDNFVNTYFGNYSYFKGVLYPIVQNVNGLGGALVLQALAAFKGTTLTQPEIDAQNSLVDLSLLLTQNPYENYNDTVNGNILQPLENFNWVGQFDKVSPASAVFSSNQFQQDISNLILEGGQTGDIEELFIDLVPEDLEGDSFENASFTVAYSPVTQSWLSYYSFTPDYYVAHNNYFQTGNNFGESKFGLWSHLLTNKSYTVFYGDKYPWIVEFPVKENYTNKILKSVEYWMDSRRYTNNYDFAENRKIGFDKAWIYNYSNNSGQLNLITEEKNNMYQKTQYPKISSSYSEDILATEYDKKWTFNYFFNRVKSEFNNVSIWSRDENNILKTLNTKAISFNSSWKDRLRGDWFLVRLQSDKESRFKQIFKWLKINENLY